MSRTHFTNHLLTKIIILGALVSVGTFLTLRITQELSTAQAAEAQALVNLRIAEQELLLQQISEAARRGEADATTELVIVDCSASERNRFDLLLDALNTPLSQGELREAELLLNKCGGVAADRRAFMSARLLREVEVFETLQRLSLAFGAPEVAVPDRLADWKQLAQFELQMATQLRELVTLQGRIIELLLDGKRAESTEIQEILKEVRNTQNVISITNQQMDNVRESLERL